MGNKSVNAVSGLRRSVLEGKSRKGGTGSGWKGSWRDRYDIPKAEEEDILLTRGAYPNPDDVDPKTNAPRLAHFHTCLMHHIKLKPQGKGSFLTARCGLDAKKSDCLGCKAAADGDRRIGLKPDYSFNILHFGLYESVPLERDGKVVKYEEGEKRGQPILVWEPVVRPSDTRRIKDDLDRYLEDGTVRQFQKRYIEVGGGHRDDLAQIDVAASKLCRCGGDITPIAFLCESCGGELADVEKQDLSKQEIAAFSISRARCKCGHTGVPVPENICNSCSKPEPLSAFDVVARVRKEGEGTNSHIVVRSITPLDQYRLPSGEYLIEFEKIKGSYYPTVDEDGAWVFTEDQGIRKAATSQWDFEQVHVPKDHDYLAKQLGIKNPFPPEPGENKYKRYGETPPAKEEPRGRGRRDDDADDDADAERDEAPRRRGRDDRDDRDDRDEAPRRRGGRSDETPSRRRV